MANDFIGFEVMGLQEVVDKLKKLPPEAQNMVIDEINPYLLNIMRRYEPKNYVTRKAAYGQTFFSEKQRRYFFAALRSGEISVPGKRTQTLSRGWKIADHGKTSFLYNEVSYARYVQDDETQSRHERMVGWKGYQRRIKEHMKGIMQKADAGVKKAIKKLGL